MPVLVYIVCSLQWNKSRWSDSRSERLQTSIREAENHILQLPKFILFDISKIIYFRERAEISVAEHSEHIDGRWYEEKYEWIQCLKSPIVVFRRKSCHSTWEISMLSALLWMVFNLSLMARVLTVLWIFQPQQAWYLRNESCKATCVYHCNYLTLQ